MFKLNVWQRLKKMGYYPLFDHSFEGKIKQKKNIDLLIGPKSLSFICKDFEKSLFAINKTFFTFLVRSYVTHIRLLGSSNPSGLSVLGGAISREIK